MTLSFLTIQRCGMTNPFKMDNWRMVVDNFPERIGVARGFAKRMTIYTSYRWRYYIPLRNLVLTRKPRRKGGCKNF